MKHKTTRRRRAKLPVVKLSYMRLGKHVRNALDILVPIQCRACGSVWKIVTVWTRGKRTVRKRVTCGMCGKRQYGKRAEVQE